MGERISVLLGGLGVALGLMLPVTAGADALTYSFSGTVDSSSGLFAAAGPSISGTYTFDYAAADPLVSGGSLSDLAAGVSLANIALASPPPSVVFTAAFTSGGFSYASPLTTASGVLDLVGILPGSYSATDSWVLADGSGITHSIVLNGPGVFDSAGLPVLGAGATSLGELVDSSGLNALTYHLTSLRASVTQAPEIDPASGMAATALLLAVVAVIRGRRADKRDRPVRGLTAA